MIFEPRSHIWVRPDFNGDEFTPRDHLIYNPSGVHFAGSIQGNGPTYLICNNLNTVNVIDGGFVGGDNGRLSFSFWAQNLMNPNNNSCTLWVTDPGSLPHGIGGGGPVTNGAYTPFTSTTGTGSSSTFQFSAASGNSSISPTWNITPQVYPPTDSRWHHYLGAIYTNRAQGSKIAALYIDDVLINTQSLGDLGGGFFASYAGKTFVFGDDIVNLAFFPAFNGLGPDFNVAEVWIAPGYSLLDVTLDVNHREIIVPSISVADRRIFTTVLPGGTIIPNDYRIFPPSAILFTSAGTAFGGNLGFGGPFTLVGSLSPVAGPGRSA